MLKVIALGLALLLIPAFVMGCANHGEHPFTPEASTTDCISPGLNSKDISSLDSGRVLWGIWNITLDPVSYKVYIEPVRNVGAHFDVTGMITPPECDDCLSIAVNSFDPVTRILGADVTLRNPYAISGYDVRGILYTNDYGHLLKNADDWTKLFEQPGGQSLNPFKAFAKNETDRKFAAGVEHTELYLVYIPAPPSYFAITFAVTASWPGNAKEPYSIESFTQGTLYDHVGAYANLNVEILDWQDDVDAVFLEAPGITGVDYIEFIQYLPDKWSLTIINNTPAPVGDYEATIIATSEGSGDVALYDFITITVSETSPPVILNIQPGYGERDEDNILLNITGQNFSSPVEIVLFKNTEEIVAIGELTIHPGLVQCLISIPADAKLGFWSVKATNPDESFGVAEDAFEVKKSHKDPWALTWGGTGADRATDVCVYDVTTPRIFTCGYEESKTTAFLAMYEYDGTLIWKRNWGNSYDGKAFATSLCLYSNAIYVVGGFTGIVDFDPDPEKCDWHTAVGGTDIFVVRFNSQGEQLDSAAWGGSYDDCALDVECGETSSISITGFYQDMVDFEPGNGNVWKTSNGGRDAFLSKFNSQLDFSDCVTWGGTGDDYANGLIVHKAYPVGEIYVGGSFEGIVDFDPGDGLINGTSNGSADCYLNVFDTDLNHLTVVTWGGADWDQVNDVAWNFPTEVYAVGYFQGVNVDFDPSGGVDNFSSIGGTDAFVSKYNFLSNSLEYDGAGRWGSTWDDEANAVIIWSDGYYVTGGFLGTVDFDPGSGTDEYTSGAETDVFLTSFNAADSHQWTRTWGADGEDKGLGLAAIDEGIAYISGYFEDTVDFDPGPGEDWHISAGLEDAFLSKFPASGDW